MPDESWKEPTLTQVARGIGPGGGNRPGVALPIRIHDLLLTLAGRLDDDALGDARQMLASAELDRSLEFLAGCLAAGRVVLTREQHTELEALFAETYLDASVIDRVMVTDRITAGRHRFAVGSVDGRDPDRGVADAIRPVLDVLPDVRSVWCVWRLTPAGPASGPVPHLVVLVGIGPGGFAPATAYRVEDALRRAGIRASVEVLMDGVEPDDYHREAMRNARQVPFDGHGSTRPRVEPARGRVDAPRIEASRVSPIPVEPSHIDSPPFESSRIQLPRAESLRSEPPRTISRRAGSRFEPSRDEPFGTDSRSESPHGESSRSGSRFASPRDEPFGTDSRDEPLHGESSRGGSRFEPSRDEAFGSDSRDQPLRGESSRSGSRFEPSRDEAFGSESLHGESSRSGSRFASPRDEPFRSDPSIESPHAESSRVEQFQADSRFEHGQSSRAESRVQPPRDEPFQADARDESMHVESSRGESFRADSRVEPLHGDSSRGEPPRDEQSRSGSHEEFGGTSRIESSHGESSREESFRRGARVEPLPDEPFQGGPREEFGGGSRIESSHGEPSRSESLVEPPHGGSSRAAAGDESSRSDSRVEPPRGDSPRGESRVEPPRDEPFRGESRVEAPRAESSRSEAAQARFAEQSRPEVSMADHIDLELPPEPPRMSAVPDLPRDRPSPVDAPRIDAPHVEVPVRKDPPFAVEPPVAAFSEPPPADPPTMMTPAAGGLADEPPKVEAVRKDPFTPPQPAPQFEQERQPEDPPKEQPPSALRQETRTDSAPSPRPRPKVVKDEPAEPPAAAQSTQQQSPQEPPAKPHLAAANGVDKHSQAFVDDILNTQERNLLRELQDELARREHQDAQPSGAWQIDRAGRHGKPGQFDNPNQTTGPMIINGVPPHPGRRGYPPAN